MPRTSRGRGAPLWLLWHRGTNRDGGHVPAASPLPSSQEQPPAVGWDASSPARTMAGDTRVPLLTAQGRGQMGSQSRGERAGQAGQQCESLYNTVDSPSPRPSSPHAQPEPASSQPGASPAEQALLPGSCQKAFN